MKKAILFFVLYVYARYKSLRSKHPTPDNYKWGDAMFLFYDSRGGDPEKGHSVVAFVLPEGKTPGDYKHDMIGPFGYSSDIDLNGLHLYGRDTWGAVQEYQILDPRNGPLRELANKYPGRIILLAGVRRLFGRLIEPLNHNIYFEIVERG